MKKIIYWVAAFLCMACSDDHGSNQENGGASGSVTEVTPVTSDLSVDLSTDKAFYKPGGESGIYSRSCVACRN